MYIIITFIFKHLSYYDVYIVLYRYRTASQKVFEVLSEFSQCVQRASIDEAYIDLTSVVNDYISSNHNVVSVNDLPNTFVEGYSDQLSTGNLYYNINLMLIN